MDKIALDRWIESAPYDDGFDCYCEKMVDYFSDEFFEANEDWIIDSEQSNKWNNKLFNSGKSPIFAAKLIERAHRLYKL